MTKVKATKLYLKSLTEIEDFIFESTEDIMQVESFIDAHDNVVQFIKQNPTTPAPHPKTGDQSWPFSGGRYRLFFKLTKHQIIYLLDVIDNRMLNKDIYPNNSMPTYTVDE